MANRKNDTTEKTTSKAVKPLNSKTGVSVHASMPWQSTGLTVLLVVVLVCCTYFFIQNPWQLNEIISTIFSPSPLLILMTPPFALLLVFVFCCLALYLLLANRRIGKFSTICTLFFGAVALLFVISALPGMDRRCEGLICTMTSTFPLYVTFLNPFISPLWIALSIIGIVLLARRLKQRVIEKKKASKGLTLAYILTGIAIPAVIAYLTFWFNYEFPKTFHIFGRQAESVYQVLFYTGEQHALANLQLTDKGLS